ncbi:hypothetical protein BBO99_00002103 [Phytophthora kernoviae]|uniref:Uncharacterized protein n=2 Tax=Phytophthora kernoviae TaxID=325452 RepID=A0A3R7KX87_9STRA|nr:hypothetical protein G195_006605 [Phytophthora kernoviae 00238/432]KAG2521644.1 hypothetical protein JM16_003954 [Phytophthora kernoviae]KAG2523042.1 hypothetical protein JM18_005403 [Phytophthora kernoviae]RLN14775.1 hypothetical protein BBI17_002049 [Phytophthora kernoviae]RLN83447.1 hypothetical protein BBO99_00002103 [Phytophthora kernoviae]
MDSIKRERHDYSHNMKQDTDPWRGSSGFGLADILNRSSSSNSTPPPKFSLPSLHSFGKTLLTKSEMSMAPPRSLLHDDQESPFSQQRSASSSPERQASSPVGSSRRIAPAPAEEEDAEQEAETANANASRGGAQPIRGGRWTADEHERFLEGFRIHGHKWKRVQQVVRTRSVTQVRTHAQKYLLKVAKLKAEKKQGAKTADMSTLAAEQGAGVESGDGVNTAPSTPERNAGADSPRKTPRKKIRRLEHGNCDPVDQEYIAAAATTLCFLMSQKIDSLFDTRNDSHMDGNKSDLEPYDCYTQQTMLPADDRDGSRKRSYMHFLTDQQDDYSSSYDPAATHGEPSSYTIEGSKLCM